MDISLEEVVKRNHVWLMAEELVNDVAKKNPIEDVRVTVNAFSGHTVTASELRLDHIIRVADWLLDR